MFRSPKELYLLVLLCISLSAMQVSSAIVSPSSLTLAPSTNGGSSSIKATWLAVTMATGYQVTWNPPENGSRPQPLEVSAPNALITGLTPGQTYKVSVRSDINGGTYMSVSDATFLSTTTAPSPPNNLALSPSTINGSSSIIVEWKTASGEIVTGYEVTWSPRDADHYISMSNSSQMASVKGLTPGQTYTVQVNALSGTTKSSPAVQTVTSVPSPPTALTLNASTINGSAQIAIGWSSVSGEIVSGYSVTWAPAGGRSQPMNVESSPAEATISNLTPGQVYAVHVAAQSGTVTSPAVSNNVSTVPSRPRNVTLSPSTFNGSSIITVKWIPYPSEVVTGYEVVLVWWPTKGRKPIILVDAVAASTLISPLVPGQSYSVRVWAISGTVASAYCEVSTTTAPSPPNNLRLNTTTSGGRSELIIAWNVVKKEIVSGYSLTWTPNGGVPKIMEVAANASTANVTGLTPGQTYAVQVRAQSDATESTPAAQAITAVPSPPNTLKLVTATSNGKARILASWIPYLDEVVSKYEITWHPNDGISQPLVVGYASASNVSIDGLKPVQEYEVQVVTISEAVASEPTLQMTTTLPSSPSNLTLRSSTIGEASQILVNWGALEGENVTGYRVTWTPIEGIPQPLEVDSSTTAANITGLTLGQTYSVKVAATNGLLTSATSSAITTTGSLNMSLSHSSPIILSGQMVTSVVCSCLGYLQPRCLWFRKKSQVTRTIGAIYQTQANGTSNSSSVLFANIGSRTELAGKYECRPTNWHGNMISNVPLDILVAASVSVAPKVNWGIKKIPETFEVDCVSIGWPAPNVTWIRNSRIVGISAKSKTYQARIEREGLKEISRLHVNVTGIDQAGVYKCSASNINNSFTVETSFYVQAKANLSLPTYKVSIKDGYHDQINCTSFGYPKPQVHWKKYSTNVSNFEGDDVYQKVTEETSYKTVAALVFARIIPAHAGHYICHAGNVVEANAQSSVLKILTVKVKPTAYYLEFQQNTLERLDLHNTTLKALVLKEIQQAYKYQTNYILGINITQAANKTIRYNLSTYDKSIKQAVLLGSYLLYMKQNSFKYLDGVPYESTCEQHLIQNFTFPKTTENQRSYSTEQCTGGRPMASLMCFPTRIATSNGIHITTAFSDSSLTVISCSVKIGQLELKAPIQDQLGANEAMTKLEILTSNRNLTSNESASVLSYLEQVQDASANSNVTVTGELFGNAVRVISHLATSVKLNENTNNLVKLISSFSKHVQLSKREDLTIETNQLVVTISDVSKEVRKNGKWFAPVSQNDDGQGVSIPLNITIPSEFISEQGTSQLRIAFALYFGDQLFPSLNRTELVVSAEMIGTSQTQKPPSQVGKKTSNSTISFQLLKENSTYGRHKSGNNKYEYVKQRCVFWDFATSSWSTRGCCLDSSGPIPTCKCSHLTNFALIFAKNDLPPDVALSVVSNIGCAISVLGYSATAILHFLNRPLLKSTPVKIQLHIACNQLVAYLAFLAGATRVQDWAACTFTALLLQFTFLASWTWMTIYGHVLYKTFVKVFSTSPTNMFAKANAIGYGVPLSIVVLNAAFTLGYVDKHRKNPDLCNPDGPQFLPSAYRSDNVCWLRSHSLYFGFLLFIGLCLIHNLVVVAMVVRRVAFKREEIRSTAAKHSNLALVLMACCLIFTAGLTWVFGFLMILSEDSTYTTVMSWLFTLFNAFQGVVVFYTMCVKRKDMFEFWWKPLAAIWQRSRAVFSKSENSRQTEDSSSTIRTRQTPMTSMQAECSTTLADKSSGNRN